MEKGIFYLAGKSKTGSLRLQLRLCQLANHSEASKRVGRRKCTQLDFILRFSVSLASTITTTSNSEPRQNQQGSTADLIIELSGDIVDPDEIDKFDKLIGQGVLPL